MPTEAASAASAELLGLGLTTAAIAVYAYESYSSARKRAASEDEDTEANKNTAHDNVRSSRKASKKRPKMVAEAVEVVLLADRILPQAAQITIKDPVALRLLVQAIVVAGLQRVPRKVAEHGQ